MKHLVLGIGLILVLAGMAQAQGVTFPFRDDFNGSVSSFWQITNADPIKYSLADNPGYLRIYTTPTDVWLSANNLVNLFTVPIQQGTDSFVVTAKISFPIPDKRNCSHNHP